MQRNITIVVGDKMFGNIAVGIGGKFFFFFYIAFFVYCGNCQTIRCMVLGFD